MDESHEEARTVVLRDTTDENGLTWLAVTLTEDGGLAFSGQDIGRLVEDTFGFHEYEFERRLSAQEAHTLAELLGAPTGHVLLAAIADRFPHGNGLEEFLQDHRIQGRFWNRIGD